MTPPDFNGSATRPSAAMPTLEQRAIVAKAINTLTGKQFSGPDLGRAIAGVGFKFRAPGSSR